MNKTFLYEDPINVSEAGLKPFYKIETITIVSTADDHTIYAHWTPNTYTVTFNANGGTPATTTKTVTYDSAYGTLTSVTRTGYAFTGWYTEKDKGDEVNSSTTVKFIDNQTLYVHWKRNRYNVTLDF